MKNSTSKGTVSHERENDVPLLAGFVVEKEKK